jgi:hypothetical protein
MQLLDHDADDSHGFHRSEIKTICISQYQDLKKKWKNVIGYRWPVKVIGHKPTKFVFIGIILEWQLWQSPYSNSACLLWFLTCV